MAQESTKGEVLSAAAFHNNFNPGPQGEDHGWSEKNERKGGKTENTRDKRRKLDVNTNDKEKKYEVINPVEDTVQEKIQEVG
eukprot:7073098-Ditylum_brightwellii.AAC.1